MAIDFPNSPIEGQSFEAAGLSWVFTGGKWLSGTAAETTIAGANAGDVKFTTATTPPADWALCDGSTIINGQTAFPDLWAVIPVGMKSGANIILPDLRGRTIIGTGTGAGLTARALLATGGVETVTLSAAQSGLPSHLHTNPSHFHANQVGWGAGTESYPVWDGTSNKAVYGLATTGGGAAVSTHVVTAAAASASHDNMQPWLALNAIICLKNGAGASGGGGASVTISDTPPVGASEGNLWYESDTGRLYIYYDLFWVEIGHPTTPVVQTGTGVRGPKAANNNGAFDIWQRGAGPFTASNVYDADQWLTQGGGTTWSVTRQAFALGNTIPGYEPMYYRRVVVTSSAGTNNYCASITRHEGVRTFAGQTVTVSFFAKADAAKPMSVEYVQDFGAGGSPSAVVRANVYKPTLSTTWQRYSVTFTLPSIAGKTLGTDGKDNLAIIFWMDSGSGLAGFSGSLGQQSGTFDIWGVQVEQGNGATAYEHRPVGDELERCLRYFERIDVTGNQYLGDGLAFTTTSGRIMVPYFPKRATGPTVTFGGTWTLMNAQGTDIAVSSLANNISHKSMAHVHWTTAVSVVSVSAPVMIRGATGGGAYCDISAEL